MGAEEFYKSNVVRLIASRLPGIRHWVHECLVVEVRLADGWKPYDFPWSLSGHAIMRDVENAVANFFALPEIVDALKRVDELREEVWKYSRSEF